jgi:peptidoglycan/LPS O-acetylase OafA/YrhL
MRRAVAFLCILGAPFVLALLNTGVPSESWWLVAAAPLGLYCIYACGVSRFFPARAGGSAPPRTGVTGVTPRGSRRDADWLLLIRGLACGLVFIMHGGLTFNHDFTFSHSRWAWILQAPASLGMILFFTLSGYLMGKGFYTGKYDLSRPGVTLYLRNRFLRIVPLMFVVGLLLIILQAPQVLSTPQIGVRLVLFEFNGTGPDGADTPLPVFWSLSTEWQYYLLVPAAFAIALAASRLFVPSPKVLLPVATLLVLGVAVMNRDYVWTHHGAASWGLYIYPTLIGNIDVFLLGFLANWWVPRLARFSRVISTVWPLLLVGIYLAYSFISYQGAVSTDGYDPIGFVSNLWGRISAVILPGAVALALVLVLVGCELWNRKARSRKLPRRKIAFFLFWAGELTYPIYLVHGNILAAVQLGMPHQNSSVKWAIATVLVVLIAWILHMTVEQAVLDWRKRRHRATETEKWIMPGTRQVGLTRLVGHRARPLVPSEPAGTTRSSAVDTA